MKAMKVGVIGLGYVGLPLLVEMANVGLTAYGVDVDARKARKINAGLSYIEDVPSSQLRRLVKAGRIHATTDFDILKQVGAVSICVPTPLRKTKDPDISYIMSAVEETRKRLHKGQIIILESTTYPGTTDELVLPELSRSGLQVGKDFFLAFSPERVDPGNKKHTTKNTPKIIGGTTPECSRRAAAYYRKIFDTVIPVSSTKCAEMVKLLENTFRSVNIGLVNEVALMCNRLGLNVWEVIDAAATKPFGFMPFYPGPGLGGHCIPVDPHYLSWKLKALNYYARFIELAGEINASMPAFVVTKISGALNDVGKPLNGSKILVLGVAYKRDVGDLRESPALDVIELLKQQKAAVSYHDPYVPALNTGDLQLRSIALTRAALRRFDCVVITTDHSSYDYQFICDNARLIVDTRNATHRTKTRTRIVNL
jgi:UDP-N-acetyl-D-glucosamine dehydrogenase